MSSKVNKVLPYVEIELDKPRKLMFDLNAMCAYEEATGENLLNGLDLDNMNARQLRVMLWAGLIHEDKTLTLEQVGEFLTGTTMMEITRAILNAWSKSVPDPEKKSPLAESDQK